MLMLGVALLLGTPSRADAQRQPVPPLRPGDDPTSPPVLDFSGFRTFATWVDDAEVLEPGAALVSVAATRWHWTLGRGTGLPNVFAAIGVAPRVHVTASLERTASSYADGTRQTSFGDTYIAGKAVLVDARAHRVGIAVSPMLQILGNDSLEYYRYYKSENTGRVQWALPVHVQVPIGSLRAYGSAGYFSVGASFVGAALEVPVSSKLVIVGTISQSYATDAGTLADELGVSRRRTDASAGAWIVASPSLSIFGVVGRTISSTDENSMTLAANVGISLYFARPAADPSPSSHARRAPIVDSNTRPPAHPSPQSYLSRD